MAQLFMSGKQMRYLLLLLLTALLLVCPAAYAEQTPDINISVPTSSAQVFEIDHPTDSPEVEQTMPEKTPEPTHEPTAQPTAEPTDVPQADVSFSRDLSSRYAEVGTTVTLSYTVRNDGVLPVNDITVRDGLVGKVGSVDVLEPGQKKTFSARVKVTQTCTSSPVISYEYNGEKLSKRCSEKSIYLADVDIQVELKTDKKEVAPGEYVTLRLQISNKGNVHLYSMQVSEPVLGEIASSVSSLPPGEECVITRTVQMKSGADFCFTVSGRSDTGLPFTVQSNEIAVAVIPVAAQIDMQLSASADRTELSAPGEVRFSLRLNNRCPIELRNVTVLENTHGEVKNFAFVPTGEMPAVEQVYQVSESGVYQFKAQVADSVGDQVTVYSEPVYITVGDKPVEPTVEPSEMPQTIDIPDGIPYRMAAEVAAFEKLIFRTLLLLIGVLLLWYVVSKFRRLMRRIRRRRRSKGKNRRS